MMDLGSSKGTAAGWGVVVGAMVVVLSACVESPIMNADGSVCDLDNNLLIASLAPNAIPALTEPQMVAADDPSTSYLLENDRVLGVVINGEARAYPHNILWHHEIVNDRIDGQWITVTFCPLTGSGIAFDPNFEQRVLDIGVSGLLFANNLVMYDRTTGDVYGPQLGIRGQCSVFRGQSLTLMPVQEMSWERWKQMHPDTKVVSGDLGLGRNYRIYPYRFPSGRYDELNNDDLVFPMSVDRSRPIKERVLAIRIGDAGTGYPYEDLRALGDVVALNETVGGIPTAVFFEARSGATALAFDARVGGQVLTFDADPAGFFVDRETGSTWNVSGTAVAGPLAGERLQTRADAYTLFWFAWRHFQPNGQIFTP